MRTALLRSVGLAVLCWLSTPVFADSSLFQSLSQRAPQLDRQALRHALSAMQCAIKHGAKPAQRLAVIDYSRPSTEKRLYIFDLTRKRLLLRDYVAHGRASGENLATQFSNQVNSHQTSLGLFQGAESYRGKHGYSLRMDGLEPGLNDKARERAIVIHGAAYVNPAWISRQGRIGRSLGCPAVRQGVARMVVDQLKNGQFVFAWHAQYSRGVAVNYQSCGPMVLAKAPVLDENG